MEKIKQHFEEEAKEYDSLIVKLIPFYREMIDILVDTIPHDTRDSIKVVDLGCGTGAITEKIKHKFPNAGITCVDIAGNMIDIAKHKLKGYNDIDYINCDLYDYTFDNGCDAVVSSLALHHLETLQPRYLWRY